MKGYKAFEKGMICKGKQYAENTVFEEDTAEICKSGMHFCVNPLDCLDYYPIIDENGDLSEFAEVESLDEPETDDNKKYCAKKLKIGAKLSFAGFIKSSFEFIKESCKINNEKIKTRKKDNSQLAASGDCSQLAASGYNSQLAASGDCSQLAASGDYSQLAASGDYSKLAASGYNSQLELNGLKSVGANIGVNGKIKGKKGNWIVLAEYDENILPICVKSAQIDGEKIKEDTFYQLKNGEFVEIDE